MEPHEIADVENILRQANKAKQIALELKHSALVDRLEMIITFAKYLLPKDNRFKV